MGRVVEGYKSPIKPAKLDPNWRSKIKCTLITTEEELITALGKCGAEDIVAVDTETTGLDYNTLDLVGVSFCYNKDEAFYAPFGHRIGANLAITALQHIINFMVNHQGKVLFYNFLYDGRVLRKHGLDVDKVPYFDIMPLVWNVDTNIHMPALKASAKYYLGMDSKMYDDILGGAGDFSQLTAQQVYEYASIDAYFTIMLCLHLLPFYNSNKFVVDLDNAMARAMIDFEDTPVKVDMEKVRSTEQNTRRDIARLETEIYQIVGSFFKINSPEVLARVLQTMGVNTGHVTDIKGYMSTGIDELEVVKNQHHVIPRIIQYKKLTKKLSTYIEPLAKASMANPNGVKFQYQLCNVPTSRLSSGIGKERKNQSYFCAINVQSFPKPLSKMYRAEKSDAPGNVLGYNFIEDSDGKYESSDPNGNVREFLIGYPDHYVVAVDFMMEEIVIAANLSRDPAFLEPLKNGEDVHTVTARFMFSTPHIDKTQRKIAKTCNFGLLYGGNEYTLHNNMPDKTLEECREYYIKWYELHHHLWKVYMPRVKAEARSKGFSTNAFGRLRRVAHWYALGTPRDSGFADRTVWNNSVQGTAGDIMRVALVRMFKHLYRNLKYNDHFKFMGSLHDELVFSVTRNLVLFNEVMDIIVRDMTNLPFKWEIPLRVDVAVGNSWGRVFPFEVKEGVWTPVASKDDINERVLEHAI